MKAARPEAVPIAGGTDVMVEVNARRAWPEAMIDLSRVQRLAKWQLLDDTLFVGARMTFARIIRELSTMRALSMASHSVGSPQIRNRGTLGGNLGTASPAGDALTVLAVHDARIELRAAGEQTRSLPWNEFLLGVKQTAIKPDELILGARWRVLRGPQSFSKIGTHNVEGIALASLCFALDPDTRTARVSLGSVAPTVIRVPEAEEFLAEELERIGGWDDPSAAPTPGVVEEFAERVAAAARPIDDVRGSASYRRHVVRVLARRAVSGAVGRTKEALVS